MERGKMLFECRKQARIATRRQGNGYEADGLSQNGGEEWTMTEDRDQTKSKARTPWTLMCCESMDGVYAMDKEAKIGDSEGGEKKEGANERRG